MRDPPWRHRIGQDIYDGKRHRAIKYTDAGHRPQQDPGGPALWGVQGVLPEQRSGVFCLLVCGAGKRGISGALPRCLVQILWTKNADMD